MELQVFQSLSNGVKAYKEFGDEGIILTFLSEKFSPLYIASSTLLNMCF